MPLGGLVVAGVGGIGSAIAGGVSAANQTAAAQAARQQALQQWLSVNVPDPSQQRIELQRYQQTGQFSPQLQQAFSQDPTGLKSLQIDPTSRQAEVQALQQMQNVASSGGMDAQAKQQLQQGINATNANERGQRGAIEQNFAARGMGGSGAQLAAELEASQGDANQAANTGLQAAAGGEQRALQAMAQSGQMGAQLNSQDYGQAAAAAQAQDSINRFNTQNQQNVSNANVNAQNQGQLYNLENQQNTANLNTGVTNTQEQYNKGLLQQQFQNQTQKATGSANAENGVASQANFGAQNTANMWGGIGSAISQAGTGIAKASNTGSKTNDEEEEAA